MDSHVYYILVDEVASSEHLHIVPSKFIMFTEGTVCLFRFPQNGFFHFIEVSLESFLDLLLC